MDFQDVLSTKVSLVILKDLMTFQFQMNIYFQMIMNAHVVSTTVIISASTQKVFIVADAERGTFWILEITVPA